MDRFNEIRDIFENNIPKKKYTDLCYEEVTRNSMINSTKESFDYDCICNDLKTSDTILIFDKHIDFIEFKDVNLNRLSDRKFKSELRLKVIESYVTFYNFLNDKSYIISKDEIANLNLNYFFVFNRFYNKVHFIDHETFIKKYKI